MPQIPFEKLGLSGAIILGALFMVYLIVKTIIMRKNGNAEVSGNPGYGLIVTTAVDGMKIAIEGMKELLVDKMVQLDKTNTDGFNRMETQLKEINASLKNH
jgi:hypothetical protein